MQNRLPPRLVFTPALGVSSYSPFAAMRVPPLHTTLFAAGVTQIFGGSFMQSMLDFLPDRDGFAFSNNDWIFDQTEIDTIDRLIQSAITPVIGLLSPFLVPAEGVLDFLGTLVGIPPGTLETIRLGLVVTGALNNTINSITDLDHQHYGLCGGAWRTRRLTTTTHL